MFSREAIPIWDAGSMNENMKKQPKVGDLNSPTADVTYSHNIALDLNQVFHIMKLTNLQGKCIEFVRSLRF